MSDLHLNTNVYDLELIDGDFHFNFGAKNTAQDVKFNVLTFAGDLFDDMSNGIPYIDEMFSPAIAKVYKAYEIEKAALEAERVEFANVVYFDGGNVQLDVFSSDGDLSVKL
jgi:hypothetical protein